MAVHRSFVIFALVAAIAPAITLAEEFIVGGDEGWKLGVDYQQWAKDKQFVIGDTLVFKYKVGAHNVYKVNGTDFQNCNVPTNNTLGFFSGNDSIMLSAAGNKWYICGITGHCDNGMKLKITVLSSVSAPAPAPSSAATLCDKEAIFQVLLVITFSIVAMLMVKY
ncbi:hypothetical protein POUND7_000643 [Theobroma cacao]